MKLYRTIIKAFFRLTVIIATIEPVANRGINQYGSISVKSGNQSMPLVVKLSTGNLHILLMPKKVLITNGNLKKRIKINKSEDL